MMEEKAVQWMRRHNMLAGTGNVIVALSGGADSVALFHFLHARHKEWGYTLRAAHFEHGLRGVTSRRDEAFVQALCQQHGVPLAVGHGHMGRQTPPKGLGTEAWARQLRYAFLEEEAQKHSARVALAHTASDNAETVLFHLARGTGPRGLAGIPPVRGRYVRPLLGATRAEVEDYCRRHGLGYCQDETNADPAYSRNRLRCEVLPRLEAVHPGAGQAMARLAADMDEVNTFLDDCAAQLLQAAGQGGMAPGGVATATGAHSYDAAVLLAAPAAVRRQALARLAGPRATRALLEELEAVLAAKRVRARLPGGRLAARRRGRFWVEPEAMAVCAAAASAEDTTLPPASPAERPPVPLAPGRFAFPGGFAWMVEVLDWPQTTAIPTDKNTETPFFGKTGKKGLTFVADYDKIYNRSVFRTRAAGDGFAPAGRGITKPLKKWMNEAGLPLCLRGTLPLLAAGSKVLWVWDAGFAQGLAPGQTTTRCLCITQQPNKERADGV